jgi:hypothetical protein
MEHRIIRQWLIERQRELARGRAAQAARRNARDGELGNRLNPGVTEAVAPQRRDRSRPLALD